MARQFEAVYKGGFLHPLQPLGLLEDQKVFVTITNVPSASNADDFIDYDLQRDCATRADESITLEQVRRELASIPGSMSDDIIADREERF